MYLNSPILSRVTATARGANYHGPATVPSPPPPPLPMKEKGTKGKEPGNEKKCCRCTGTGHLAQVKSCPALDKTCNKCSKSRHFEACCKKKTTKKPSGRKHSKGASQVSEQKEDNYAFVLYTKNSQGSSGVVDLCWRCAVKKSFLLTRGQHVTLWIVLRGRVLTRKE